MPPAAAIEDAGAPESESQGFEAMPQGSTATSVVSLGNPLLQLYSISKVFKVTVECFTDAPCFFNDQWSVLYQYESA